MPFKFSDIPKIYYVNRYFLIVWTVTFSFLSFPVEIRLFPNKPNNSVYWEPHTTSILTPLSQCSSEIIPEKKFYCTVENVDHFKTIACLDVVSIRYEFNLNISQTSNKKVESFCCINWLITAGTHQIIPITSSRGQQGKMFLGKLCEILILT